MVIQKRLHFVTNGFADGVTQAMDPVRPDRETNGQTIRSK